jgi:hypothetical protein
MTASPTEDQRASQAVAAGMAAAAAHDSAAEQQHRTTTGSDVAIEAAASPDDVSVPWFGSDNHPGRGPTQPQTHSPNVERPTDNSQSQP